MKNEERAPFIPLELARVPFQGGEILAARLDGDRIVASLISLCDFLGLSYTGQWERIRRDDILAEQLLPVLTRTSGGPQRADFLSAWAIPTWLTGIQTSRIAPEKRPLILAFKREAADVLYRHFFKIDVPQVPPPPLPQPGRALPLPEMFQALGTQIIQEMQQIAARQTHLEQENDQLKQENQRLKGTVTLMDQQQARQVAWMAEKGHELEVQGRWMQTMTLRVDHLSEQPQPPEAASVPLPSVERLHALQTMPYEQYVHTPEWKAQREAAIKRALDRCQLCNSNQTLLFAHHRTYERRGQERPEDIFVLCASCHARHHAHAAAERRRKRAGGAGASGSEHPASPEYEI